MMRFEVIGSFSRTMPHDTPEMGIRKMNEWSAVAPKRLIRVFQARKPKDVVTMV